MVIVSSGFSLTVLAVFMSAVTMLYILKFIQKILGVQVECGPATPRLERTRRVFVEWKPTDPRNPPSKREAGWMHHPRVETSSKRSKTDLE